MKDKNIEKFLDLKKTIVVIAAMISVGIYYIGTEFIAPSRNIISTFIDPLIKTTYTFHSGNPSGNYFYLGKKIEQASAMVNSNYSVVNAESGGATSNLLQVSSSPKSIGFIQEDTLESSMFDKKFVDENINKIAYLYKEKLHVLYWPISYIEDKDKGVPDDSIENLILKHKGPNEEFDYKLLDNPLELAKESKSSALYYLSNPDIKMNLSTADSGSNFIAHALLNSAGVVGFEKREENEKFGDAMELFLDKKIHVVFYFTGTPLEKIQIALDRGAKLMGVKAVDFIKTLKQDYSILTRPAKFTDEYEHSSDLGTIGSRATLIASSDVSNKALAQILNNFKTYVDTLDEKNGQPSDGDRVLPMNVKELDAAISVVEAKQAKNNEDMVRNILLFIVSLIGGTLVVLKIVNDFVSGLKKHQYFRKIQEIMDSDEFGNEIDCRARIKNLHEKQERLRSAKRDINRDYKTGGITDDSMKFLEDRIETCISEARISIKKLLIDTKCKKNREYTEYEELIAELLSHGFIDSELADRWIDKAA